MVWQHETTNHGDSEMKPFDEEKAKAGHPLITRNGFPGRLLASDLDNSDGPLVVAVSYGPGRERIRLYTREGLYKYRKSNHPLDLFMAPVKKWRWVLEGYTEDYVVSASYYATKEEAAESCGFGYRVVQRIDETMIEG